MNTIHIAQGPGDESYDVPQLFAGDTPAVVTRDVRVAASQAAIPQYTPLAFDDAGVFVVLRQHAALAVIDAVRAVLAPRQPQAAALEQPPE